LAKRAYVGDFKTILSSFKRQVDTSYIPKLEKIPSGIPGLDNLMGGGFTRGSTTLICGPPGVGKTIFSLQYIYKGAKEFGDRGLYITCEQPVYSLKYVAKMFNWDIDKLEKVSLLKFIDVSPITITLAKEFNLEFIETFKPVRVVIDSISAIIGYRSIKEQYSMRKIVFEIMDCLRRLGTAALLVSEVSDTYATLPESYVADGVISLEKYKKGPEIKKTLHIAKLRHACPSDKYFNFQITSSGINVSLVEEF
jgi:KaiC/GvpD/RAD55 family RecA-like ATPase